MVINNFTTNYLTVKIITLQSFEPFLILRGTESDISFYIIVSIIEENALNESISRIKMSVIYNTGISIDDR